MIKRLLIKDRLGHSILDRSVSHLFRFIDKEFGSPRYLDTIINMESYFRSNLNDKLLFQKDKNKFVGNLLCAHHGALVYHFLKTLQYSKVERISFVFLNYFHQREAILLGPYLFRFYL